jgi:hypothetical protein
MLKKLFFISFTLLPFISIAQIDNPQISFPMKNGIIYFEKNYNLNGGLQKGELYERALKWLKNTFPISGKSIKVSDKKNGEILGSGIFKIITSGSGNYYWVRFMVNIAVSNGNYSLKVYNFYEKPIESGISNEYSKLEYRWWDFKQGKPWSTEDQMLFKGLDADINTMMTSLEKI